MNVLKSGDVVYRCSKSKSCKKSITLTRMGFPLLKPKNDHTCNMESDERKSEAQVLRVRVRKTSGDISKKHRLLWFDQHCKLPQKITCFNLLWQMLLKPFTEKGVTIFQHCQKVKMIFMMLLKFWTQKQINQKFLLFLMTDILELSFSQHGQTYNLCAEKWMNGL